jgi:hypothetical protein
MAFVVHENKSEDNGSLRHPPSAPPRKMRPKLTQTVVFDRPLLAAQSGRSPSLTDSKVTNAIYHRGLTH